MILQILGCYHLICVSWSLCWKFYAYADMCRFIFVGWLVKRDNIYLQNFQAQFEVLNPSPKSKSQIQVPNPSSKSKSKVLNPEERDWDILQANYHLLAVHNYHLTFYMSTSFRCSFCITYWLSYYHVHCTLFTLSYLHS